MDWRRLLSYGALFQLCAIGGFFVVVAAFQPSQGEINIEQRLKADNLEHRIERLEHDDLSSRLKVLESDMWEVKWLARGAALALVSQIIMGRRVRKMEDE